MSSEERDEVSNSLDDVWGSDSGDEQVSDYKKLKEVHSGRGYLNGITESKQENLQEGFNDGFPCGSELGLKVGKILGTLQLLDTLHGMEDISLRQDYNLALQELKIDRILTKSAFDEQLNCNSKHPAIEKWNVIVENHYNKYNEINQTD